MNYELYVDVLFLVNFLMDYILLLFVWKVLHCDTRHIHIVSGAILGAFFYCLLIILPIPNAFLEFILFHLFVNTCMIHVGLKIKRISDFLKAFISLYIGAFFVGGIMESVYQYISVGGLFLLLAFVGYYLAIGMWKFLCNVQKRATCFCEVELCYEGKTLTVTGIIDTGNGLHDPLTNLPVSVLGKNKAEALFGKKIEWIRYIPYCSIGKSQGVMPVIRITEMRILGEESRCFERPLIGISEEHFNVGGKCDLILNPNLF